MVTGVVVLGGLFLLGVFLLDAVKTSPPEMTEVPVLETQVQFVSKKKAANKKRRARKTVK